MKRFILSVLLLVPSAARAQILRGTITDANSGVSIGVANVQVLTLHGRLIYHVLSADDGSFQLLTPAADSFRVRIERIGYAGVTSIPIVMQRGELLDVEVRLSPEAIKLDSLQVTAQNQDPRLEEYYRRLAAHRASGDGKFITRKEIERIHSPRVSHLMNRVPKRDLMGPGAGCTGDDVYIDDLPVRITPQEQIDPDWIDLLVAPEDVEGIEVYRYGEIPIQYDRNLCSVVLIWRRPYGLKGTHVSWKSLAAGLVLLSWIVLQQRFF